MQDRKVYITLRGRFGAKIKGCEPGDLHIVTEKKGRLNAHVEILDQENSDIKLHRGRVTGAFKIDFLMRLSESSSVDKAVKHLSFSLENSNPRVDPFGIGYDQLGNPTVKVTGYEITDSK